MVFVPLRSAEAGTCGGKAGGLGALLRAGLPVPDGFVLPFGFRALDDLDGVLGSGFVAVRSSAADEDTGEASAAGQYVSVLGVRGVEDVSTAIRKCWDSVHAERAVDYRGSGGTPDMAVIVQRHVDAEVSGVMFTPAEPGGVTRIEASWGLGPSVVEGRVTPDQYLVSPEGAVARTVADKRTRLDRLGSGLAVREVAGRTRNSPAIDDATAVRLAELGGEVAGVLGGPQDVEWAITGTHLWILQSRPITAPLPPARSPGTTATASTGTPGSTTSTVTGTPGSTTAAFAGTPGSRGTATGVARIVRGPADFARVRPGDILVCPFTDPAWTPLLRIAAGVVTETGGVLSHAAIVARERGIPAVLGIPGITAALRDGAVITIDGATGTITGSGEPGTIAGSGNPGTITGSGEPGTIDWSEEH